MQILGLDVSKDNVTCCLLSSDSPTEPRQLYLDGEFPRLYANSAGIQRLLELEPDVAVLEPTGVNYSKLWVTKLAEAGIEVALVGHKQLRTYRESLDLPDKDDIADAIALAHYYQAFRHFPSRFVRIRDPLVAAMRDQVLRLHHLARLQSPLINRIRQDLAWQYPEAAKRRLEARLFWRWLAGEAKSVKYEAELATTCGMGITEQTRKYAGLLCEILQQEGEIELKLRGYLADPRFTPYRQVFAQFGFGERVESLILSQIYPIENYLENGELIVKLTRSKQNPKRKTRKLISERRFLKSLGLAPTREYSGDQRMIKKAGSRLCRTALWQWLFTRIEVKKARPKTEVCKEIADYFDQMKTVKPIQLARSKTCALAVRRLLHALVDSLDR